MRARMIIIIDVLNRRVCGSGSVVERRLAKANVASSNLVFRSNSKCGEKPHSWRHSQEVRQRPAKPSPPVQIWVAPPRRRKLRDHNPTLKGGIFSRFDSSSSFRKKVTTALSRKKTFARLSLGFFRFACLPTFCGYEPTVRAIDETTVQFQWITPSQSKVRFAPFF